MIFPVGRFGEVSPAFASLFHAGHRGIDVFAPVGAPVYAMLDGHIWHAIEPKGGKVVYLRAADGTQVYYGHLDSFAGERLGPGQERAVKAGELIGYVGTTGNAAGKSPHVHLELRPQGGPNVDPFPFLRSAAWGGGGVTTSATSATSAQTVSPFGVGVGALLLLGALYLMKGTR